MALTYGQYLKVPELLSLQEGLVLAAASRRGALHHHPSGLRALVQARPPRGRQRGGPPGRRPGREATRLLRRVVEIQHLLVNQVRILETHAAPGLPRVSLPPRTPLPASSPCSSASWSSCSGSRTPLSAARLVCEPEEAERLQRRLAAPSPPTPSTRCSFAGAFRGSRHRPAPGAGSDGAGGVAPRPRWCGSTRSPTLTPTSPRSARSSSRWTSASRSGGPTMSRWWRE